MDFTGVRAIVTAKGNGAISRERCKERVSTP